MKNLSKKVLAFAVVCFVFGSATVFAAEVSEGDGVNVLDRSNASCGQNFKGKFGPGRGKNFDSELREKMDEILSNADYEAFQELAPGKAEMIDEADFGKMVEAFELREAGDLEGAKKIMEELHESHREEMELRREAIKVAIESGDYETFVSLTKDGKRMFENVNADNFYLLKELGEAKEGKDFQRVKEILEELGVEKEFMGRKGPKGKKRGEGEGFGDRKNLGNGEKGVKGLKERPEWIERGEDLIREL